MQGPRHDHEVGLVVEDMVNHLQALDRALIYADPDIRAATTTRCVHHGRPGKCFPLSLDPACPRAGVLVRCLGCITQDVRAELEHPVLMKATVEVKRNLEWMGLTRSTPYSAGWNVRANPPGECKMEALSGWGPAGPVPAGPCDLLHRFDTDFFRTCIVLGFRAGALFSH